ncbi:hypothetical protein NHQ30_009598 [Ciborinia camelliae]|nr:hypothetical protein NHQ30_009598 [Ciborinia camelliae]
MPRYIETPLAGPSPIPRRYVRRENFQDRGRGPFFGRFSDDLTGQPRDVPSAYLDTEGRLVVIPVSPIAGMLYPRPMTSPIGQMNRTQHSALQYKPPIAPYNEPSADILSRRPTPVQVKWTADANAENSINNDGGGSKNSLTLDMVVGKGVNRERSKWEAYDIADGYVCHYNN